MTADGRDARVLEAVSDRRELVNAALDDYLPLEEPRRLYEASRYLLDAGGKRLRPTVLLLAAESVCDVPPLSADYRSFPDLDGGPVDVLAAAVSIEIIQSFTLIHDDIMDGDDLRRGVPSVHRAFDMETAILAGDTLYSKAFEVMLEVDAHPDRCLRAISMLAETCTEISEGQSLDVSFERRTDVETDQYLDMIERKTGTLYASAAAIPAILLGADDATVEALADYGRSVGRAFQVHDDVLDLTVSSDTLGKRRGSDLVEGKQTLITLHARSEGVDVDGLLGDATAEDEISDAEIDAAVSVLESAGSIAFARETAHNLATTGQDRLAALPDNPARERLRELADFLVEREY